MSAAHFMETPYGLYRRVADARNDVACALRYLRASEGEGRLIELSVASESIALHCLDWVLGRENGKAFEEHLQALRVVRPAIERRLKEPTS